MKIEVFFAAFLVASSTALPTECLKKDSLKIISRSEWGAREPKTPTLPLAQEPAPYVVIHHSATPRCKTERQCTVAVKAFQNYHIDQNKWNDIAYNFVVGEDGNIYEGRGWGYTGAHARTYNDKSIGICVIGNFVDALPNKKALNAVKDLIEYGVSRNEIDEDYELIGHNQAVATLCPGAKFYNEIKTWPHWKNV